MFQGRAMYLWRQTSLVTNQQTWEFGIKLRGMNLLGGSTTRADQGQDEQAKKCMHMLTDQGETEQAGACFDTPYAWVLLLPSDSRMSADT